MALLVGAVAMAATLVACSRKGGSSAPDAAADGPLSSTAAEDAAPGPPISATDAGFELAAVDPVEARRARVQRFGDHEALRGLDAVLERHFGGGPHAGFDVQVAELTAAGRRVVLVSEAGKPTSEARPIAIVARDDGVVWSKERPVAGIMAPVGPIAIAPAPLGRVALAACDPPTNVVALRIWDDDGTPFADFEALPVDGCEALSLLYWPDRGWIIVAVRAGATRAQLVGENGSRRWGLGLDLGARSRPGAIAPASLAADTDDTFVLVQMVQPSGEDGSPFHALAFRYDTRGTPIWRATVDLKKLDRPPAPGERVRVSPTRPGVRVTLPSGAEVDVRPSGDVIPRGRARR